MAQTCHALFVLDGITDVPVVRECLARCYGAREHGPLVMKFPGKSEQKLNRSKLAVGDKVVGLYAPGGEGEAEKSHRLFIEFVDTYPNCQLVVLVQDMDKRLKSDMQSSFVQSMKSLAENLNRDFLVEHENPAQVRIGGVTGSGKPESPAVPAENPVQVRIGGVTAIQLLCGDSGFGLPDENAMDDHILAFLKQQPSRDPSNVRELVENHLGRPLNSKQQILLGMMLDNYWGYPSGYYERVVKATKDDELNQFCAGLGIGDVIKLLNS